MDLYGNPVLLPKKLLHKTPFPEAELPDYKHSKRHLR